jgi:lipopolysaccharide transport system ATP-binding protein
MSKNNVSIKVGKVSKRYRIGLKETMDDSFANAVFGLILSPLKNYRKYRALYKFDEENSADVIWALRDVSFEAKQGEVIGIIGRNGAGKSTLLKILSKITDPTTGRCEIRGRVSSLLEVGTGFHPELTGRENVYLNGTILGMRKKEVDAKFDEIVEFSGVEKFIDTPIKRYSSGMQVRLAFAVAAHLEPEILIVDEVLAVGDAEFQKRCLDKMQHVGQAGRTVLFVSHNMPAITRLCQRTILLDEGRLIEDDSAPEVVAKYLQSGYGLSASREWNDIETAPGNDTVRLRAVRIRQRSARITESLDIRDPVGIEMEYVVLKPGYSLLPHFTLYNESGVCVFVGIDQDQDWRGKPRPVGHYVSTGWIPGNLLAEGTMFVSPVMRTVEPDLFHFHAENAVAFQVIESSENVARGGYTRAIPGIIRPLLKWKTEYEPSV